MYQAIRAILVILADLDLVYQAIFAYRYLRILEVPVSDSKRDGGSVSCWVLQKKSIQLMRVSNPKYLRVIAIDLIYKTNACLIDVAFL